MDKVESEYMATMSVASFFNVRLSMRRPFLSPSYLFRGVCLMLLLVVVGCARPQSQYDMLASRFTVAADKLEKQRTRTMEALQVASEAQTVAIMQEDFDFRSDETLAFVLSWETAGSEVSQLRRDVQITVGSTYEMLDGLRSRAQRINDPDIRDRTVTYVEQRRQEFDVAVLQTENAILSMEAAMQLGDDIIESLRIVGTANLVRQKIGELQDRQAEAIAAFPNVDSIIQEGRRLLNIEFGEQNLLPS